MLNVTLKVLKKSLNFLFKKGYEPCKQDVAPGKQRVFFDPCNWQGKFLFLKTFRDVLHSLPKVDPPRVHLVWPLSKYLDIWTETFLFNAGCYPSQRSLYTVWWHHPRIWRVQSKWLKHSWWRRTSFLVSYLFQALLIVACEKAMILWRCCTPAPSKLFSVRFGQEHSMLYPLDLQSLYTHSNWGELYHALITLVLPYFPNWSGGLLSREKCFWLVDVNFPRGTTLQKYYSDLCSDMSWVWNFCAGVSYVILRGNQWWRREMRVFSHARNPFNARISAQKMANS